MEQSVYCAENHTAKQTTNQKNRPFDFQQNKQQTKRTVPLISRSTISWLCTTGKSPSEMAYCGQAKAKPEAQLGESKEKQKKSLGGSVGGNSQSIPTVTH